MDEVEIKYRLDGPADHERLRAELRALGARPSPLEHEDNRLFSDAAGTLARAGGVLRLRVLDGGPRATLTYKGPARFAGAVKTRREIEVDVSDGETTQALLEALGYTVTLVYRKEREAWHLDGVEVALDTLAFGHFCEIEGPADAITALAQQLGLRDDQVEPRGYPTLTAEYEMRNTGRGRAAL
jgi:predicted adenylyl cyclase CyaB